MSKPTRPYIKPQSFHTPVQKKTNQTVIRQAGTKPVAPPVYRPQPTPKVLQRKTVVAQPPQGAQSGHKPIAPPVYRPQPVPKVLQAKMPVHQPDDQSRRVPVAPPVYRPQPVPKVLQTKKAGVQQPNARQPHHQPVAHPASRPETKSPVQPRTNTLAQSRKDLPGRASPSSPQFQAVQRLKQVNERPIMNPIAARRTIGVVQRAKSWEDAQREMGMALHGGALTNVVDEYEEDYEDYEPEVEVKELLVKEVKEQAKLEIEEDYEPKVEIKEEINQPLVNEVKERAKLAAVEWENSGRSFMNWWIENGYNKKLSREDYHEVYNSAWKKTVMGKKKQAQVKKIKETFVVFKNKLPNLNPVGEEAESIEETKKAIRVDEKSFFRNHQVWDNKGFALPVATYYEYDVKPSKQEKAMFGSRGSRRILVAKIGKELHLLYTRSHYGNNRDQDPVAFYYLGLL